MGTRMHEKERHMQNTPATQAPNKEGPFLPRFKDRGILARFGEACFCVVGATSLERGIWYDISIIGLRKLIALTESEKPHE